MKERPTLIPDTFAAGNKIITQIVEETFLSTFFCFELLLPASKQRHIGVLRLRLLDN